MFYHGAHLLILVVVSFYACLISGGTITSLQSVEGIKTNNILHLLNTMVYEPVVRLDYSSISHC